MLHIINKSPNTFNINKINYIIKKKDNILLYNEGVIFGLKIFFKKNFFKKYKKVYILKNDILARGISKYIVKKFIVINYISFIKLVKNNKYIIW